MLTAATAPRLAPVDAPWLQHWLCAVKARPDIVWTRDWIIADCMVRMLQCNQEWAQWYRSADRLEAWVLLAGDTLAQTQPDAFAALSEQCASWSVFLRSAAWDVRPRPTDTFDSRMVFEARFGATLDAPYPPVLTRWTLEQRLARYAQARLIVAGNPGSQPTQLLTNDSSSAPESEW